MAIPTHLRLTWGGRLFNTEIWTMGMTLVHIPGLIPGAPAGIDEQAIVARLQAFTASSPVFTAIKTWYDGTSSGINAKASLDWAKIVLCVADPEKPNQRMYSRRHTLTPTATWTTSAPGSSATISSTPSGPPQLALAITYDTAIQRGAGSTGRTFMPCGVLNMDAAAPTITTGTANQVAGWFKTMCTSVEAAMATDQANGPLINFRVGVVSPGGRTNGNTPTSERCIAIKVGRMHDVMTSRRGKFQEAPVVSSMS